MSREITLRDYGRVLWRGRLVILTTTVAAALVGLILTFVTTTTYTATAKLFLGQATTTSGVPVQTPLTNPATAAEVLIGDQLTEAVAQELGMTPREVRAAVEVSAPRAPGGSAGNQPTVATITFTDDDLDRARAGANAYADGILASAEAEYAGVLETYRRGATRAREDVARLTADIARYQRQLEGAGGDRAIALQTLILSAGQQLQIAATDRDEQELALAKEEQLGQPEIISRAGSPTSSARLANRARTVVLAGVIGLLVGVIITFVWRGSPAGRAGPN